MIPGNFGEPVAVCLSLKPGHAYNRQIGDIPLGIFPEKGLGALFDRPASQPFQIIFAYTLRVDRWIRFPFTAAPAPAFIAPEFLLLVALRQPELAEFGIGDGIFADFKG